MINLVYGQNAIIKLITQNPNDIISLYILKINKKTIFIAKKAKKLNLKIIYIKNINNKNFFYIRKYNSIICKIKTINQKNNVIEDLIQKNNINKVLILDRIQDPYNFAACIRTAEAFSFDTIITNEKNTIKPSSLINKISNGANLFTKIIFEKNIIEKIKLLKNHNFEIIGLSSKSKNIIKNEFNAPIAIIVGSEKNGISKELIKECTNTYKIQMKNTCKNINVSVITGIILSKTII
ncbi:MAG TPA: TrmH family RNA methyltransferase [Candidatus Azoamicus sp.]